jgi:hypothetical protein
MALATCGHVIEELEGSERRPAEEVIREAHTRSLSVPSARQPNLVGLRKNAESRCKSGEAL